MRGTGWIWTRSSATMSSTRSASRPTARSDLHDDHDMERRRFGQTLAESAAQIDDRNNDAAQVEHAANVIGLLRQMRDLGPTLDLAHRHDVDAVLIVADGEADELRRRVGRREGRAGQGRAELRVFSCG